jgi:hypothetical protein
VRRKNSTELSLHPDLIGASIEYVSGHTAANWKLTTQRLLPVIKQVRAQSQFVGYHCGGLATIKPVLNRFAFESLVEFAAGFDRCFFHGLDRSLFAHFPVRQFEATSGLLPENPELRSTMMSRRNFHPWFSESHLLCAFGIAVKIEIKLICAS